MKGEKADGAAFAVCMAVTNPDAAKPHQRASMIIVPTDTPGFDLVRNISVIRSASRTAGWRVTSPTSSPSRK